MRTYQDEYVSNLTRVIALSNWSAQLGGQSFEDFEVQRLANEALAKQLTQRNMELLRGELFPTLDNLFEADEETLNELEDFSFLLFDGRNELDVGLFCQIHQALLALVRQKRDRAAMIRELYWLGMGRYSMSSKLVGLDLPYVENYIIQMRLCFAEAAAHIKYFDEIEDNETRGYILRACGNISLGRFKSPGEKIALVRKTLQILQDKDYQKTAPDLPWERLICLTHQQMASSISYDREQGMSAEDTASIMDSVFTIQQQRLQSAKAGEKPPAKQAFSSCAINYYCGIYDLDQLLTKMEELLGTSDPADYSENGMYAMISLTAFYCQFLQQNPDRLPGREEYLEYLYRRVLRYAETFPGEPGNAHLFHFLRQLAYTFVETEHSISYGAFILTLLLRFAPEVYLHARLVGEAAMEFCAAILEDNPSFFDDIGWIHAIQDPQQKRTEILNYAMGCGLFHDVGKINVIELYTSTARQWFDQEYEMSRLHTIAGETLLSGRPSTCRYASAALGHHAWYDGSRGYPSGYRRLDCPERLMVDVIGLIDWLENVTCSSCHHTGEAQSFDEAIQTAISLEGRRFSPLLIEYFRTPGITKRIQDAFLRGRGIAFRRMYEDSHTIAS